MGYIQTYAARKQTRQTDQTDGKYAIGEYDMCMLNTVWSQIVT